MKPALKKNCRVDYTNGYSLLIDYTTAKDIIIYYEVGYYPLNQMWSTYEYRMRHEMPIDLYPLHFFPYPVANK